MENPFEKSHEHIPTEEDVASVFESVIDGPYEEVRRLKDEQGLYLWEVKVETSSGVAEYMYIRKGSHPEAQAMETVVNVVYYDGDMPAGGHSTAKLLEGEWHITK